MRSGGKGKDGGKGNEKGRSWKGRKGMRPVREEVEVWHLSPGVQGNTVLRPQSFASDGRVGASHPTQPALHVSPSLN